jgi:plastocyanin
MRRRLSPLLAAVVVLVLAAPATAGAKIWTAYAGSPTTKAPTGTPKQASLNLFFPSTLKIHQGDSVRVKNNEFHTASILAKGQKFPSPFAPDPSGGTYNVGNDAAGNPFYFNGKPKLIYNPAVFGPVGGTTIKDTKEHSSGIFGKALGRPAVTYKFTRRGSYTLLCLIHPGMKAKITVASKKSRVQSNAAVTARVAREAGAAFTNVKRALQSKPATNVVYVGIGAKATNLSYLPAKLTVKAGTAVDFVNRSASEPHNVTFGPKDYLENWFKTTDLLPAGPGAPNQLTPIDVYGTDPPGAGNSWEYDGTAHGNGFFATPVIDNIPGGPLPGSSRVIFTKPGTYHYICAIHGPEMSGDVVVTQ